MNGPNVGYHSSGFLVVAIDKCCASIRRQFIQLRQVLNYQGAYNMLAIYTLDSALYNLTLILSFRSPL